MKGETLYDRLAGNYDSKPACSHCGNRQVEKTNPSKCATCGAAMPESEE